MELKQKYTKADMYYEADDEFVKRLQKFGSPTAMYMAEQIECNVPYLKDSAGTPQQLAGVYHTFDNKAVFYNLLFLKEKGAHPILIDITPITSDQYLDKLNLKQTLRYDHRRKNSLFSC